MGPRLDHRARHRPRRAAAGRHAEGGRDAKPEALEAGPSARRARGLGGVAWARVVFEGLGHGIALRGEAQSNLAQRGALNRAVA